MREAIEFQIQGVVSQFKILCVFMKCHIVSVKDAALLVEVLNLGHYPRDLNAEHI